MRRRTEEQTRRLEAHVFVCTHEREEHPACADADGVETLEAVEAWLREREAFWSPIGVSRTGCLGLCSVEGTAITIQPRNEWYAEVRPGDVPALLTDAFGSDAERVGR